MLLEPPAGLGYEIYVPVSPGGIKEILKLLHMVADSIQYAFECCNTECHFLISNAVSLDANKVTKIVPHSSHGLGSP